MICNNCTNREICVIYEFKKKHEINVSMNISECKHKTGTKVSEPNKSYIGSSYTNNSFTENIAYLNATGPRPDAREAEKKILNIETIEEDKTLMTCATCGGTDYADYITICSKCGTEVCGNCSTSDNGLTYCEKCWEEI